MWPASDFLLARRYQLDDRIAAGGFGEVWRGSDTVLARLVAIKLLHPGHSAQPETLERFRAEARNAGALGHENIARVYDYGEPDAQHPPFLVMEFVDGPSLAAVLAGGPLSPARTLDIVAQAAAGLHAAHLAGVVHRDIKPGNLLLAPGGQVKITDFGISHSIGSAPVTSTGMLLGTAGYLSPEQVAGSRATAKSDLYSLGVVAYECLSGAPPFAGSSWKWHWRTGTGRCRRCRIPCPLRWRRWSASSPPRIPRSDPNGPAWWPARPPGSATRWPQRATRSMAGQRHQSRLRPGLPRAWRRPEAGPRNRPPETRRRGAPAAGSPTLAGAAPGPLSGADEPAPGRPPRGGRRTGRVAALAAAAVAVALTGWLLAGWPGAARPPQAAGAGRAAPSLSTAKMVHVRTDALIGRPVTAVTRQLRQLGLVVQVRWEPSPHQAAGTVVAVLPGGWVRSGSAVAVTGALRPPQPGQGRPARPRKRPRPRKGPRPRPGTRPRGAAGQGSSPSPAVRPAEPVGRGDHSAGSKSPATPSPSATPTSQPTPGPSPTTSTAAGRRGNSSR